MNYKAKPLSKVIASGLNLGQVAPAWRINQFYYCLLFSLAKHKISLTPAQKLILNQRIIWSWNQNWHVRNATSSATILGFDIQTYRTANQELENKGLITTSQTFHGLLRCRINPKSPIIKYAIKAYAHIEQQDDKFDDALISLYNQLYTKLAYTPAKGNNAPVKNYCHHFSKYITPESFAKALQDRIIATKSDKIFKKRAFEEMLYYLIRCLWNNPAVKIDKYYAIRAPIYDENSARITFTKLLSKQLGLFRKTGSDVYVLHLSSKKDSLVYQAAMDVAIQVEE